MATLSALRAIREQQALSLRDLAKRAHISPTTILRAEHGHDIYPLNVRKLAKALGVTPAELRGDGRPSATPEPPATVPVGERQAMLIANLLSQAERARARGDDEGTAMFERMAAEAAP